eukprot:UN00071
MYCDINESSIHITTVDNHNNSFSKGLRPKSTFHHPVQNSPMIQNKQFTPQSVTTIHSQYPGQQQQLQQQQQQPLQTTALPLFNTHLKSRPLPAQHLNYNFNTNHHITQPQYHQQHNQQHTALLIANPSHQQPIRRTTNQQHVHNLQNNIVHANTIQKQNVNHNNNNNNNNFMNNGYPINDMNDKSIHKLNSQYEQKECPSLSTAEKTNQLKLFTNVENDNVYNNNSSTHTPTLGSQQIVGGKRVTKVIRVTTPMTSPSHPTNGNIPTNTATNNKTPNQQHSTLNTSQLSAHFACQTNMNVNITEVDQMHDGHNISTPTQQPFAHRLENQIDQHIDTNINNPSSKLQQKVIHAELRLDTLNDDRQRRKEERRNQKALHKNSGNCSSGFGTAESSGAITPMCDLNLQNTPGTSVTSTFLTNSDSGHIKTSSNTSGSQSGVIKPLTQQPLGLLHDPSHLEQGYFDHIAYEQHKNIKKQQRQGLQQQQQITPNTSFNLNTSSTSINNQAVTEFEKLIASKQQRKNDNNK